MSYRTRRTRQRAHKRAARTASQAGDAGARDVDLVPASLHVRRTFEQFTARSVVSRVHADKRRERSRRACRGKVDID